MDLGYQHTTKENINHVLCDPYLVSFPFYTIALNISVSIPTGFCKQFLHRTFTQRTQGKMGKVNLVLSLCMAQQVCSPASCSVLSVENSSCLNIGVIFRLTGSDGEQSPHSHYVWCCVPQ